MPEHQPTTAPSTTATPVATPPVTVSARIRRPWLWALLAVALALDVLGSAGVLPLAVGILAGLVALGCAAALVVARVRRR